MTGRERHVRAKEVFLAACDMAPGQRLEFLASSCDRDEDLRREVDELLACHDQELGAEGCGSPGKAIGGLEEIAGYRIVRRLGEGGMGEVYEAEQLAPVRRRVALKVIRWGMDSREILGRFEAERQAMAIMNHPAIAMILDAGVTSGGRPFFAMEYVEGVPITRFCDDNRLTTVERMRLFQRVCEGVQHAHHRGVIHRDLKPSNILVARQDGHAVPKIIDFGVAKATRQRLTENVVSTRLGQWIGTPEYMSPEQAEMAELDVDARTDVYSLGVVLYELLVGAAPIDAAALRSAGFDEMRRRIREDEPPRPSTRVITLGDESGVTAERRRTDLGRLVRELRGDLDCIVMKALEKDRARRYGSPSELAADLERHLAHEPVLASPPSAAYRLGKLIRRHRAGAAAALLVIATLVLGMVGTSVGMVWAQREAETAQRVVALLSDLFGGMNPEIEPEPIDTILDRAESRVDRELAAQPLLQARLKATIGNVRLGLGHFDEAWSLLEQAEQLRAGRQHDDPVLTAGILNLKGLAAANTGRLHEALELHRSALDVFTAANGPGDLTTGQVLGNICFVEWRLGRFEAALEDCGRARGLLESSAGADGLEIAGALFVTSLVLRDLGRLDEALAAGERSLEIRERHLPADHTSVGWALWLTGGLLRARGDLAPARASLERSLAIQETALGRDSYAAALGHQQLGALCAAEGDLEAAVGAFERSLDIFDRLGRSAHPDVSWTLRQSAYALRRQGDRTVAEHRIRRSLDVALEAFGPDHPEVAWSLAALARLEVDDKHLQEARSLFLRAERILVSALGPSARAVGSMRYNLACVDALAGRREDALAHLRGALETTWAWAGAADDADLASLRGDAEYRSFVDEVRRRLEQTG